MQNRVAAAEFYSKMRTWAEMLQNSGATVQTFLNKLDFKLFFNRKSHEPGS
jgi:hypothetical protein